MRRFHRSAAEVKMCRSARLHILGAEAEERSDEAHDAVLYAVARAIAEPGRRGDQKLLLSIPCHMHSEVIVSNPVIEEGFSPLKLEFEYFIIPKSDVGHTFGMQK